MAMQGLVAACKYLTIFGRLNALGATPAIIGQGAVYFPAVGLILGFTLALLNYALGLYLASEILSILLVAVLLLATGARHLDGTKRTFDAMASSLPLPERQEFQSWGFAALVFIVLFKTAAIDVIDETLTLSLLLTPVLARWSLVLFLYGYRDRFEGISRAIADKVNSWQLLATTAFTLGLAVYFLGRRGLWLAFTLSVFTLVFRNLLYRRHAVLTHDNFGAVVELSEVLALILLASL
jgi:adenosylcobinamide-GDP ribazoletransferase